MSDVPNSLSLFHQFTAPSPLADPILEAWGDVVEPDYGWDSGQGYASGPARTQHLQRPMTTRWDRLDGRYLPVYQNEMELAYIRAEARAVAVVCPSAVNVLATKANYVLGKGFTFTAKRDDTAPVALDEATTSSLVGFIQKKINRFIDRNKLLCNQDREIQHATIEDGEAFLSLKLTHTGDVLVHRLEPDQIVQPLGTRELENWLDYQYGIPCDSFVSSWTFGVHTRELEPQNPIGYHVLYDAGGANWDYIRESHMVHIKANAPAAAKRGVSDFYPVCQWFRKDSKLLHNVADGAKLQAAIAWIRQHATGTTVVGATNMVGGNKTGDTKVQKQTGGQQLRNANTYLSGSILDVSAGMEYLPGPMGSERNVNFLLVTAAVKREIGTRWAMPEYMISGDSSNANFASTLVSGAPFVKACEAEQRFYGQHFLELIWKALRIMFDAGQFDQFVHGMGLTWEQLEQIIEVIVGYPTVETKDPKARADAAAVEVQGGWLSPKTACEESGRDWDVEQANGLAATSTAMMTAGSDPLVTTADAGTLGVTPAPVDVASTAMNGAQVSSLVDFITQVTAGTLPAESAIQAIALAFPTVSLDQARAMINPAAAQSGVTPPTLAADGTPVAAVGTPAKAGGELVGMKLRDVTNIDKLRTRYLTAYKDGTADEKSTRLALDGLGISAAKIDLYLDADVTNDPVDDHAPEPEQVAESLDVTTQKRPGRDVPKRIPTQQEIVNRAAVQLDKLYDQLSEAMQDKAPQSKLKMILEQIETLTLQAQHAAQICGMLTPFKPTLNDADSAKDSSVKQQAAVVTVEDTSTRKGK